VLPSRFVKLLTVALEVASTSRFMQSGKLAAIESVTCDVQLLGPDVDLRRVLHHHA
jgi:hypothetical protein